MNPLSLLNPATLLLLGILVLFCSLLFVYFENKAREQNHKISSMLSLVSSLTEEVQTIRRYINSSAGGTKQQVTKVKDEELISVSDDETYDEELEDDSCAEESCDDDDSCDDEESCDDEDSCDDSVNVIEIGDNIKILTLLQPIEIVSDNEGDNEGDNDGDVEVVGEDEDEGSVFEVNELLDDLDSVSSKEPDIQMFDLKTIHLEESAIVDYKKLSIGKLRSIVTEKGLAADSSKLKKQEILKLLGVE